MNEVIGEGDPQGHIDAIEGMTDDELEAAIQRAAAQERAEPEEDKKTEAAPQEPETK